MPTVAIVDGIKIEFYHDDHPPPHFHAIVAEFDAQIDIETLEVVRGYLKRPQYRKVKEWAQTRKPRLRDAWEACREDQSPGRVE